jgi:hypothetical protein
MFRVENSSKMTKVEKCPSFSINWKQKKIRKKRKMQKIDELKPEQNHWTKEPGKNNQKLD